ncbi:hypothetical protein RB213_001795 [Colletotrichum asianum]
MTFSNNLISSSDVSPASLRDHVGSIGLFMNENRGNGLMIEARSFGSLTSVYWQLRILHENLKLSNHEDMAATIC